MPRVISDPPSLNAFAVSIVLLASVSFSALPRAANPLSIRASNPSSVAPISSSLALVRWSAACIPEVVEGGRFLIALAEPLVERAAAGDDRLLDHRQSAVEPRRQRLAFGVEARDHFRAPSGHGRLEGLQSVAHGFVDGAGVGRQREFDDGAMSDGRALEFRQTERPRLVRSARGGRSGGRRVRPDGWT